MTPDAPHTKSSGAAPLEGLHRWSGHATRALALVPLVTLLGAWPGPPTRDEGTAAHIFQLSVVGAVLALMLFLATAEWRRPWKALRPLALPVALLVVAFRVLYLLEHSVR